MSTLVEEKTVEAVFYDEREQNSDDDDLVHSVCECRPFVALCGAEVSGELIDEIGPDDLECVVCVDLESVGTCEVCEVLFT